MIPRVLSTIIVLMASQHLAAHGMTDEYSLKPEQRAGRLGLPDSLSSAASLSSGVTSDHLLLQDAAHVHVLETQVCDLFRHRATGDCPLSLRLPSLTG